MSGPLTHELSLAIDSAFPTEWSRDKEFRLWGWSGGLNSPSKRKPALGFIGHSKESSFCRTLGWPIVADAVSGLRVTRARTTPQNPKAENPKPPIVYHFDHVLLGAASDETRTLLAPDVVLQLGTRVTSKRTCTFLDGLPLRRYVLVDSHPFRHDPSHVLSHRVEMKIAHFATAVVQEWGGKSELVPQLARFESGPPASIEQSASAERSVNGLSKVVLHSDHGVRPDLTSAAATLSADGSTLSEYGRMLVELSEAVGREIVTCLDEEEDLSEPQVARIVAGSVAAEGTLFLGNSMAIRVRNVVLRCVLHHRPI
jgi:2-succinyl-5-enolpyruvyl-6-hydroxy-3-cyclohexene-1-carboxylate synthase